MGDAGLDDQKMFAKVGKLEEEFAFRVCHLKRTVEVYNERLYRWETECLQDLTDTVVYQATFEVTFTHAGHAHENIIKWLRILGGKLGLASDRGGPYWLLQGIAVVIVRHDDALFRILEPFSIP